MGGGGLHRRSLLRAAACADGAAPPIDVRQIACAGSADPRTRGKRAGSLRGWSQLPTRPPDTVGLLAFANHIAIFELAVGSSNLEVVFFEPHLLPRPGDRPMTRLVYSELIEPTSWAHAPRVGRLIVFAAFGDAGTPGVTTPTQLRKPGDRRGRRGHGAVCRVFGATTTASEYRHATIAQRFLMPYVNHRWLGAGVPSP